MDLYSPKDKILLKNCIVVKLKYLELEEQKPDANIEDLEERLNLAYQDMEE